MYIAGRPKDVIVRLVPAVRNRKLETSGLEKNSQIFDALIYSKLDLPIERRIRESCADVLRNLPAAGVERITITSKYEAYLASFLDSSQGFHRMRDLLLESMSAGLKNVLTNAPLDMQVWWSAETPELDDCPWELAANVGHTSTSSGRHTLVFLRGLPPETPIPAIPVSDTPRLAVLGSWDAVPEWIVSLASGFPNQIQILHLPLRDGIREAVASGFEFIHIFAKGAVSSALDGLLYDAREDSSLHLTPGEMSRLLSGSRVVLLGLSSADSGDPNRSHEGNRLLSAYRAFAHFGASTVPLPSVIAPLGPLPGPHMSRFWDTFYRELINSWHLTESLRMAQANSAFPLPVALFCRHAGGTLFRRTSDNVVIEKSPVQIQADLLRSVHLTKDLSALNEKYGGELPDSVKRLFEHENQRQTDLRGKLDQWIDAEEDL